MPKKVSPSQDIDILKNIINFDPSDSDVVLINKLHYAWVCGFIDVNSSDDRPAGNLSEYFWSIKNNLKRLPKPLKIRKAGLKYYKTKNILQLKKETNKKIRRRRIVLRTVNKN